MKTASKGRDGSGTGKNLREEADVFRKGFEPGALLKALLWTAVICFVFYRSLFGLIAALPAGILIYLREKTVRKRLRQKSFNRQFRDALRALKGRIISGNSLENALTLTLSDLRTMYGEEAAVTGAFSRIKSLRSLNIPADECLYRTALIYGDRDMTGFARVVRTMAEKGGSMADIIQRSADRIAEKIDMEEGLETAVAGKKNEFLIMRMMPVLVIVYLVFFNPSFTAVLYETAAGKAVMTVCLLLYLAAWMWGERITELRI